MITLETRSDIEVFGRTDPVDSPGEAMTRRVSQSFEEATDIETTKELTGIQRNPRVAELDVQLAGIAEAVSNGQWRHRDHRGHLDQLGS